MENEYRYLVIADKHHDSELVSRLTGPTTQERLSRACPNQQTQLRSMRATPG